MDDHDIVTRLRVLNHHAKKLAENESLHDLYREAFTRCEELTLQAAAEIKCLRRELDEARRDWCRLWAGTDGRSLAPTQAARLRGWDCFKKAKK